MDFSRFSDNKFDVKDWINEALGSHDNQSVPIDAYASNLVMKLQLFIQEVNKSLEETSQVALNNMPKVLREVENLKMESMVLKEQMQMVKDDIRQVEENTSQSMRTLIEIDDVKVRMLDASGALKEADNWAVLSSNVEEVMMSGDLDQISEKLIGMQKSLNVLKDVPDYSLKEVYLEGLKDRLEARVSIKLVVAFNGHVLDDAKKFVSLFSAIDRLPHLQSYYNNCHKTSLLASWHSIHTNDDSSLSSRLSSFFENMISLWHQEVSWCAQVFPAPASVLCTLFLQTFNGLDPSIGDCISQAVKEESVATLGVLIGLQEVCNHFIAALERAWESYRGLSDTTDAKLSELLHAVQAPMTEHLISYAQCQEKELMMRLKSLMLENNDVNETVTAMCDSVDYIFELIDGAKQNCITFTHCYGAVGLLHAVKCVMLAYFDKLESTITSLRTRCLIDDVGISSDDGLEATDQWANFQIGFQLIEMCGHILRRFSTFQQDLLTDFNAILPMICKRDDASDSKSFPNYFLPKRPSDFDNLIEFHETLKHGGQSAILPGVELKISVLNGSSQKFAFDAVFVHLKRHLVKMPYLDVWRTTSTKTEAIASDLPSFSLSPQGYITQVGDYLLMLPQQLEPFFVHDNEPLKLALGDIHIPYINSPEATSILDFDHIWLAALANGTMELVRDSILRIPEVTTHSTKQLLTDLEYFRNVLEALEVPTTADLHNITMLFEVPFDSFHDTAANLKVDPILESALAKIRRV